MSYQAHRANMLRKLSTSPSPLPHFSVMCNMDYILLPESHVHGIVVVFEVCRGVAHVITLRAGVL